MDESICPTPQHKEHAMSFARALSSVVDSNTPEEARAVLETHAPHLLRSRDFLHAVVRAFMAQQRPNSDVQWFLTGLYTEAERARLMRT